MTDTYADPETNLAPEVVSPSDPAQVDYFGFDETLKVTLPDGVSWVEIKKLNEDMDEIYARVDAINATMAEWKNLLPNLEKAIAEIRQEVKAISDLKAEVGSKYRFLIGSDELQDERLAVLEKRLGIDYLAGTPADSTQPS